MVEKVKEFLANFEEFAGMQVDLETMQSGRVTGQVIWEGFEPFDHVDRQQMLRRALRRHFAEDAQLIGILLTYTPAEMAEMVAA